jgi:hypothetical protein
VAEAEALQHKDTGVGKRGFFGALADVIASIFR